MSDIQPEKAEKEDIDMVVFRGVSSTTEHTVRGVVKGHPDAIKEFLVALQNDGFDIGAATVNDGSSGD